MLITETKIPQKHHILSQLLHWVMVFVMFALFITVASMQGIIPKFSTEKSIHETLGLLIFIFTIARIINRAVNPAPPYSGNLARIQLIIVRISEIAIYTLVILQSLTGWLLATTSKSTTKIAGLFPLPSIVPINAQLHQELHKIHPILGWILLSCIAIHIIAIIIHALVLHDEIFQRMTFSLKKKTDD